MKKIIALVVAGILAAGMLVSCGEKFECQGCMKEKSGKQYEFMGLTLCKDCYEDTQEGLEQLGDMFEGLGF